VGLEDRLRKLERRLQPKPVPDWAVIEETRRAVEAIVEARHDGTIRHGEPLRTAWLTEFLIGRGVSRESAAAYVAFIARRWPGGTDS
jgi:hypothetical protein